MFVRTSTIPASTILIPPPSPSEETPLAHTPAAAPPRPHQCVYHPDSAPCTDGTHAHHHHLHRRRRHVQGGVLLLWSVVVIIVAVDYSRFGHHHVAHILSSFLAWVGRHPIEGAVAFAGVYALSVIFFVPGAALTLGGGFLFGHALGVGVGTLIASIAVFVGASLGALLSFFLGRCLLKDIAQNVLGRYPVLRALDAALRSGEKEREGGREEGRDVRVASSASGQGEGGGGGGKGGRGGNGLKVMLLLRLSPLVPFSALNYLMSVTSITIKDYTIGLVGMLPAVVAYSFLGTTAGKITKEVVAGQEGGREGGVERGVRIGMYVLGGVSLVVAVGLMSRYARRELRRIEEEGEGGREGGVEAEEEEEEEGEEGFMEEEEVEVVEGGQRERKVVGGRKEEV